MLIDDSVGTAFRPPGSHSDVTRARSYSPSDAAVPPLPIADTIGFIIPPVELVPLLNPKVVVLPGIPYDSGPLLLSNCLLLSIFISAVVRLTNADEDDDDEDDDDA